MLLSFVLTSSQMFPTREIHTFTHANARLDVLDYNFQESK